MAAATGVPLRGASLDLLQRLVLVETSVDPLVSQTRRAVRASDRVIALACGDVHLDPEIAGFCAIERSGAPAVPASPHLVAAITAKPAPAIVAVGPRGAGRSTALRAAAA